MTLQLVVISSFDQIYGKQFRQERAFRLNCTGEEFYDADTPFVCFSTVISADFDNGGYLFVHQFYAVFLQWFVRRLRREAGFVQPLLDQKKKLNRIRIT